jgi:ketosteroid isomerase-like protein
MSQENLDVLRGVYKRWAAGDWTDNSIFDPHAVAVFPDPTPRAHYGLNALAEYMRRFLESWDDLRMEATDYREAGDSFVVRVHRIATGSGSGVALEDHAFHVWTFRGRKAIRLEGFEEETDALEAAGLSE